MTFTITGGELAAERVNVVTDENGIACYDGLLLSSHVGDYTVTEQVPINYHVDDGDVDEVVSVTETATCESGTQAEVTFLNIPLTNITVSVDSIVDGGTASTINCELQGGPTVASGSTGPDGDGSVSATNLEPGTYVCTIVVDP